MIKRFLSWLYYEKGFQHIHTLVRAAVLGWFGSMPRTRFIIFAQGRTGSTLLVNILNCSPDIFCDGEVFGSSMPWNIPCKSLYLKQISRLGGRAAYGCRIKIYDLYNHQGMDKKQAVDFLHARMKEGWKIVHLVRSNKLRQALSMLVADESKVYHINRDNSRGQHTVQAGKIPERIKSLLELDEDERKALKGFDKFPVFYESDLFQVEHHQRLLDDLCEYLGVRSGQVKTTLRKTSESDISAYIVNHGEVQKVVDENNLTHYMLNRDSGNL